MDKRTLTFALILLGSSRVALAHPLEESEPAPKPESPRDEVESGETREIIVEVPPDTASAATITREQIDAAPIRTAEDALRLAPGMVMVQHGAEGKGQQYFLRGFDAVHGLDFEIEVDGVPLNEWSNIHAQGYLDLGMLIPEMIRDVEVLPGPFALDQGPFALAGSARFRLGVPLDARGLRAKLEFGSTLRARTMLSYSPADGDGERFIAADVMTDQGFGESRDSRRAVVMARQPLWRGHHHQLTALIIAQASEFGLPGTTSLRDYEAGRIGFWGAHDNGHGSARRAHAALDWLTVRARWHLQVRAWSGYRRLELLENFTGFFERPVEGDRRVQRHASVPFGARVDHHAQVAPRLELRTGLGVRGDVFEQSEVRVDLERRPFETTRELAAAQANVWAQAGLRWRLADALELAAGVRVDAFGIDAHDRSPTAVEDADPAATAGSIRGGGLRWAASPRGHLRWAALARLDLFAAYGRGFRPPEARAFTAYDPERVGLSADVVDEGPRTSASDSGELGLRWRPDPRVQIRVVGFATYVGRESIYDHVSRTSLQLSATRRLGAELGVEARPVSWLGLAGSVTWVDGRFVSSRNPIPLAPTLVGSARAWLVHRIGARAGLTLVGWAPRPLPYGARGSGLARLDATAGWHLERVFVDLAIENVLGLQLREGEYYFASNFDHNQTASSLPTLHYVPGPALNARLSLTVLF
ncbi:Outer membrane receptor protein [Enhygromyxa salina]|uniref:Outer membrane receptor protein n=1 Tax=Enhygromyxa salina TaxID=215803 RepID=A0A0C2DD16_9BACT|nr:TonB-dependent receptor [Enhygromyxa salina]KIG19305.1 Outer membrane receptor protein [Enhygromyxa salina]